MFILADNQGVRGKDTTISVCKWLICFLQNIPNELKNKTTAQVILTFFTPPVGALIAAMVSTFGKLLLWNGPLGSLASPGIYFIASFLYVSLSPSVVEPCAD